MSGAYEGLRMAARAEMPGDEEDTETNTMPEDEKEESKAKKKKEPKMSDETITVAQANDMASQAASAASKRYADVLGSDVYVGREKTAAALLSNDKLSASEITTLLASVPVAAAPLNASDGDDPEFRTAALKAMDGKVEDLGTDPKANSSTTEAQTASEGWAKAVAETNSYFSA